MSSFYDFVKANLTTSMLRWGVVALCTAFIDYLIFIALYARTHSVFGANLFSGLVATSFNYIAHYRWTFNSYSKHRMSGAKYILNWTLWWIVGTCVIKLLIFMKVNPGVAKLLPLLIIAPASYLILKKVVFAKS